MADEIISTENQSEKPAVIVGAVGGLRPKDFEQMWRIARVMSASGMMPKGCERPEQVFVAIEMGLEVGLSPMQAVQNIAVINGRPSIWGDAAWALVISHPECEDTHEEFITDDKGAVTSVICTIKRRGRQPVVRSFSREDARSAGLLSKPGPWKEYTSRMIQMRARSWAMRDAFADALRGLGTVEEVSDIVEAEHVEVVRDLTVSDLKARLAAVTKPDVVEQEGMDSDEAEDSLFDDKMDPDQAEETLFEKGA